MLADHEHRWVYVGVPRTASTALHAFLPTLGALQVADEHIMQIPESCYGYRVFATALNPFRRAFGLWRMLQKDAEKGASWAGEVPAGSVESFRVFTRKLLLEGESKHPVHEWTVSRWLEIVSPKVEIEVVRSEELDEGLRRLGILPPGVAVPVRNRTQESWLEAYDAGLEEDVRRWARDDFERFGYPADLRTWRRLARREGWSSPVLRPLGRARGWAEHAFRLRSRR